MVSTEGMAVVIRRKGLDNYQQNSSRILAELWLRVPQVGLNMILVVI